MKKKNVGTLLSTYLSENYMLKTETWKLKACIFWKVKFNELCRRVGRGISTYILDHFFFSNGIV